MIDFEHGNKLAIPHVRDWVPGGELQGEEYVVRNPTRDDKRPGSFKININTGKWSENASDEGGDAVSLRAYLDGTDQGEAFNWIISQYDPTYFPPFDDGRSKNKNPTDYWAGWRYCHKGHKTPTEVNTSYHVKKSGPEVERWPFKMKVGQEWRVIMWVVRFSNATGVKDDKPYTLWTNGSEHRWRSKAPEGKYPLYGLESLDRRPNAPVVLTEGQKGASRAEKVLDTWACVGWYGGAANIGLTDLEPLRGREVWFPFDADAIGRSVLRKLEEYQIKVHPVYPPLNVAKGWDIADAIAEGWTREKLEDWLLNSAKVPEVEGHKSIIASGRSWELQDYLEPTKLHRIFVDFRCGENSYFVHNKIGYMWYSDRKHWEMYPTDCMIEDFQQWSMADDGELMRVATLNNNGAKKGDKIYPEIIFNKSASLLRQYRGPDIKLYGENPFSNIQGVKPFWHFPNGMLEVKESGVTWFPRESYPEKFFMDTFPTGCMGFDYDPSAKEAPCFLSTVKRLLPEGYKDDPKGLKFILQCFAYSLMPRKMKSYYFICHGKQGSGKSSLVRVLKELAGGYFVSKPMRAVFSQFGKPGLVGKLVVCDDDISDDYVLPTDIKTLMANESVTVEEKGKPQYTAVMNLAPWIIGNRPPKVTGSDGHDRRAVVMHFSSTEHGDPHHMDKMFGKIEGFKDERAAIMNMILLELPGFVKTWDFDRPEWANDAHHEWITSSNSVASYFSENREFDNDHWYLRRAVYLHYAEWAELSGMKPVTSDVFYKSLAGEKIETKGKGKSVRIKCPFSLPELDREKMQILKTDQIGEKVHDDTLPF